MCCMSQSNMRSWSKITPSLVLVSKDQNKILNKKKILKIRDVPKISTELSELWKGILSR